MSQRMIAAVVAGPLVVALLAAAAFMPLPYVIYRPGQTVDVLGEVDGREIIQVDGERAYRDDGGLLMTTVTVTPPKPAEVNLLELMGAWIDGEDAVMPYDTVYREDETQEQNDVEGAIQMVTSQDFAVAAALTELGEEVRPAVEVFSVEEGAPADGRLRVRDRIISVNGERVTTTEEVGRAVEATPAGEAVEFAVRREGAERTVTVEPTEVDGERRVGIQLGIGYLFPFQVSVEIDPDISGPSAGLMFSLAVYDTLTPGSLTGGEVVAGTGEIRPDGSVGPIGGIDQKIAGARADGAELFLVPPDNCPDVEDEGRSPHGDMRLTVVETMHDAVESIDAWREDPDADLPTCADLEEAS